MNIAKFFDRAV